MAFAFSQTKKRSRVSGEQHINAAEQLKAKQRQQVVGSRSIPYPPPQLYQVNVKSNVVPQVRKDGARRPALHPSPSPFPSSNVMRRHRGQPT